MSVLILGATSPIARAVAEEYARKGRALALGARDREEAERISADLGIRYGVQARAFDYDARDFEGHEAFLEAVEAAVGPVEVALMATGFMGEQEESEQDFEAAQRVIEVNDSGAVSLAEGLARRMSERGAGSIVGIASVAGDRGRASNYIYGSAKGAFALYLQGLRNRLAREDVHVMTVKLGFVDTRMTFGMETAIPVASPAAVGRAIVRAEGRRVDVLYYPRFWRGIMAVIQAIPERVFKRLSL